MTPSGFSVQDYFINTGNKWISNAMCSRNYTPFYEKSYTYDGDRVCQKGGALSTDVIVFWAMPVKGIETATDYTERIGNTYRPAIGYAQTHVYVNGAKATTGEEITAPNYTIAPVMGTDKALKLGKAYTVNSEFYTQPKQALGYVLKEYFGVNPTRWVDDNSKNLDIPLVSNKKITQYGFQNGLSTSAKGFVQVLTQPWMELLSLYTPMEFIDNTNNDRFAHDPKNQVGRYRALQFKLPYAKTNADPTTFDYRDFVTTDAIDWCNTDQGEGLSYAYRLTYREPNSFGNSKRSPYQSLMRFTARPNKALSGRTLRTIATSSTLTSSLSTSGSTSSGTSTTRLSPRVSTTEATSSSVLLSTPSSGMPRSIQASRRATSPVRSPLLVCTRTSRRRMVLSSMSPRVVAHSTPTV